MHVIQAFMRPHLLSTCGIVGPLVDNFRRLNCFHVRRGRRRCMRFGFVAFQHFMQGTKISLSFVQSHKWFENGTTTVLSTTTYP